MVMGLIIGAAFGLIFAGLGVALYEFCLSRPKKQTRATELVDILEEAKALKADVEELKSKVTTLALRNGFNI